MDTKQYKNRMIVALDTPSLEIVKKLLKELDGLISFYKIGFELFTAHGWSAVELVKKTGASIFLDLKLHDIPNTVSKTAAVICEHEIGMFNVHALGGLEMMKAVRETVNAHAKKDEAPMVLGVTILTSHTEENLSKELGIQRKLEDQVLHLSQLAQSAGLDGVVASPLEVELIRKKLGPEFVIVTPGIRSAENIKGDQKRTFSVQESFAAGANYIVIGRPITAAQHPREATLQIINSLDQ